MHMDIRERLNQLKLRRRSVPPDLLDSLLIEAGFEFRWGGRNHAIYSHPGLDYNLSIKQTKRLKPTYVSQAIRAIEEVLENEDN